MCICLCVCICLYVCVYLSVCVCVSVFVRVLPFLYYPFFPSSSPHPFVNPHPDSPLHLSSPLFAPSFPHRSLSVEHTAHDVYKGLKQGRDVVVPGLMNNLYTYLFSRVLPSAAVGAITQVPHTHRCIVAVTTKRQNISFFQRRY